MKLTLSNFRTHKSLELQFPDKGLVLLDGVSGAGKSSVFKAIHHTLYGSVRKPVSWGESSYKLELLLGENTITRATGKNNISFNGLDGDAGQQALMEMLGMSEDEFLASSYIMQKNQNSLLTLPPAEQLRFIERLAFGKDSPDVYKEKIQSCISSLNSKLTALNARLGSINESLIDMEDQELPKMEDIEHIEEALSFASSNLKDKESKRRIIRQEIEDLSESYNKYLEILEEIKDIQSKAKGIKITESEMALSDSVVPIEGDLDKLTLELDAFSLISEALEIKSLIASIVEQAKEKKALKTSLRTEQDLAAHESLIESLKDKIAEARSNLELYASYLQSEKELQELISKYTTQPITLNTVSAALFELKQVISEKLDAIDRTEQALEDAVASLGFGGSQDCPSCNTPLHIRSGKLSIGHLDCSEILTDTLRDKILSLKQELQNMHIDLQKVHGFQDYYNKSPLFLRSSERSSLEELECLANKTLPEKLQQAVAELSLIKEDVKAGHLIDAELKRLKANCLELTSKLNEKMSNIPDGLKSEVNDKSLDEIGTIRNYLIVQLTALKSYLESKKEREALLDRLSVQKAKLTARYKVLTASLPPDAENIRASLFAKRQELSELQDSIDALGSQVLDLTNRKEKQAATRAKRELLDAEIKKSSDLRNKTQSEITEVSSKLTKYLLLKELSDKAQMAAISDVIDSLNISAKEHLDVMFQDNPISVALKPFKENKDKSVRPKLSLSIHYKGFELDSITEDVSGGENDRIILAYQLAMNSIYNSPVLMLDEPFAGLNQDMVDVAIESLRLTAQNKLVICVSHGINKGLFDEVIEI